MGEFGYSGSLSILFDNNISGGNSISIITTDGSLITNGSSPIPLSNNNRMAITIDLRQSYLLTGYLIWTRDNHFQPSPTIWSVRATNTHNTDPDLTVWTTLHSVDRSATVTSGGYTNNNGVSAPNDATGLGVYPTTTQLNGAAHSMTTNLMNNGSVNTTAFRYVQFVFSKSCPGVDGNGNTLTDYYQPGINFGEIKLFSGTYTVGVSTVENIMINNISRAIPVKPVSGDRGKVLKANATGTGLEYGTSGKILQTKYTQITTRSYYTASSPNTYITLSSPTRYEQNFNNSLSVNITPSSTSSKIIIKCQITLEIRNPWDAIGGIKRVVGGSSTYLGNTDGGSEIKNLGISPITLSWHDNYDTSLDMCMINFIDSPGTTSQITYIPVILSRHNNNDTYLNRTKNIAGGIWQERGISLINVSEFIP